MRKKKDVILSIRANFSIILPGDERLFVCFAQSVVMLMFREEKSPEDEIKAWQFWHGRQHSVKQRILDAGKFLIAFSDK